MQLYNATCRPAGQITHEVPKMGLTAPEVILLRAIHGDDGVTNLKLGADDPEMSKGPELDRLRGIYGQKAVALVFGSTHGTMLPDAVPEEWLPEVEVAQATKQKPKTN